MSDVDDNNFIRYIYRGEEGEHIPREATHITVGEDVTVILRRAFHRHRNIIEVICHENVKKIGEEAFYGCPKLRRVIMPGVKVVEMLTFFKCTAMADVECGKLEIIEEEVFGRCYSLRSIDLQSTRIVEQYAFDCCKALTNVKFSNKLERIGDWVLCDCESLERITIPLKDGLITEDNICTRCENLKHVDLVETAELQETIAALHLEEWRNDMNAEIDSINQILPNARAGGWDDDGEVYDEYDEGEKAQAIRTWIRSILRKLIHYQAEHQRSLDGAATTLQFLLPRYVTFDLVLPFLELPAHTFEVAEDSEEEEDSEDELEVEYSSQGEDSEMEEDISGDEEDGEKNGR